jgi:hypothetical protein
MQQRVNMYLELREKANEDPTFITRIITGDKSLIYGYHAEKKQQLSQWKSPQSPRTKKVLQVWSSTNSMVFFFFVKEIVHHEFVPPNTTVNSAVTAAAAAGGGAGPDFNNEHCFFNIKGIVSSS